MFVHHLQAAQNRDFDARSALQNSEGQPIAEVTTVLSPHLTSPHLAAPHRVGALLSYHPHHKCSRARMRAVDRDVHRRPEAGDPRSPWPHRRHREGTIPDHIGPTLGPALVYGAAKLGGQITLDSIRAAQRFDALGLGRARSGWPATPAAEWRLR